MKPSTKLGTSVRAAVLLACMFASRESTAYETEDSAKPTDLTITIEVSAPPIHNEFTRYLTFKNRIGAKKSVEVAFTKITPLRFAGQVTAAGLSKLQSLADQNQRSYWDRMYFENQGGSTELRIATLEVEIEYADTCCGREPVALIGYATNKTLAAGKDSFYIDGDRGRRSFAESYFGWTSEESYELPAALRYFIYDLGKSGSSDASDSASVSNPKYASSGSALCSETVSWYYYEQGEHLIDTRFPMTTYDFRNMTAHGDMLEAFRNSDRAYCFHLGLQQWVRRNRNDEWILGDTYVPQPGDYLDRLSTDSASDNGHAMMLVHWDPSTMVADTIDGPYNINFRPVDILAAERAGTDYCVGRIPSND